MESNKNEVNSNPIKTCKVCGNKETLMAYGALCCSPCKIFFRRLASTDLVSFIFILKKDNNYILINLE